MVKGGSAAPASVECSTAAKEVRSEAMCPVGRGVTEIRACRGASDGCE